MVTDCDTFINTQNESVTPFTDSCIDPNMSWADYAKLYKNIIKVSNKVGYFWNDSKYFSEDHNGIHWRNKRP